MKEMGSISAPAPVSASVRRSRRVPIIWLVPLLAVAIGAWLAWDTLSKRGPTITVAFASGEGLQAGQSQLKYKDIVLGTVQSLRLAPDHSHVVVAIATTREAGPLLTDQTVFWVVTPRLFAGNLTGLETLVSGTYVAMLPGADTGHPKRDFVGLEDPPILTANVPGRTFLLRANRVGSVSLGSPIFFRDLNVGEVLGWDIADMADYVTIRAFVRAPYDSYVHEQTRFWNASGLSVKLGASGVDVQLESMKALLLGGVAFDTPTPASSAVAEANHVFPLYTDQATADAASYQHKIPLVSYFSGSVSGLGRGSNVTIHGLTVGRVTDVRLTYDPAKDAVLAFVRYEVEPERVLGIGKRAFDKPVEGIRALVQQGWRATLQSASLITGQQVVALEQSQGAPPAEVTVAEDGFVMPTAESGGLATLTASAAELLRKVNQIPFEQIGNSADQALGELSVALNQVKVLLASVESGTTPTMRQLPQMMAGLDKSLAAITKLAGSLNNAYGDDTRFNRETERSLRELNDLLPALRSFVDMLSRHPEALIKGRPAGGLE